MDSSVAQNPVANGAAVGGAAPTGPAINTPRPIDFSGALRIPKRIAAVILNSLKGGVVPRIGLPYITVGRETEIRALLTDLDLIADGGASFRFLVGRYGAGKSFLLQTIRTHAMGENFCSGRCRPVTGAPPAGRPGTGPRHVSRADPQPFQRRLVQKAAR